MNEVNYNKQNPNKPMSKKERVNKALHDMVMNSKNEQTFTYQQISEACGLSHERIRQIEILALKKAEKILSTMCANDKIPIEALFHQ